MSISKIAEALNFSVYFLLHFCLFQDLMMKTIIGLPQENNGFYYFDSNPLNFALNSPTTYTSDMDLWY